MTDNQHKSVLEAIAEIKKGHIIIVTDDENRENEGDFIAAAELTTPDTINYMATHGKGLICAAITEERSKELKLNVMVQSNTAVNSTNFTESVDLIGHGCTTGISTHDRAKTIKALVDSSTQAENLGRPGHIFPIVAQKGGVRVRPGHTEATVEFAKLAGLKPAGVLVEIMNPDGTMARYPDLVQLSKETGLKLVTIKQLITYLNDQND